MARRNVVKIAALLLLFGVSAMTWSVGWRTAEISWAVRSNAARIALISALQRHRIGYLEEVDSSGVGWIKTREATLMQVLKATQGLHSE